MLEHFIIVANDGVYKNILIFTPPMCFTCENAHRAILALGKVLKEIEDDIDETASSSSPISVASSSRSLTSISGDSILSLEEFVSFTVPGGHDDHQRSSRSSSSGGGGIQNAFSSSPDTNISLDDLDEEEDDDGGYVTSNSFASMD